MHRGSCTCGLRHKLLTALALSVVGSHAIDKVTFDTFHNSAHLWCGDVSIFCSSVPRSADQAQTVPSAPAEMSIAAWLPRAVYRGGASIF